MLDVQMFWILNKAGKDEFYYFLIQLLNGVDIPTQLQLIAMAFNNQPIDPEVGSFA